jgi:hypothetical protein
MDRGVCRLAANGVSAHRVVAMSDGWLRMMVLVGDPFFVGSLKGPGPMGLTPRTVGNAPPLATSEHDYVPKLGASLFMPLFTSRGREVFAPCSCR